MHLGTNDVWVHDTMLPATILAAYTKVVAAARVENPSVRFLVAQIIPMNPRDPNPSCDGCAARVTALNAKIPAWAAENSTEASPITVVDQWTGFDVVADTYDGVHPNGSGSAKMAARWFAALEPLFQ
jgi:lysophospholipase L1-like esterase